MLGPVLQALLNLTKRKEEWTQFSEALVSAVKAAAEDDALADGDPEGPEGPEGCGEAVPRGPLGKGRGRRLEELLGGGASDVLNTKGLFAILYLSCDEPLRAKLVQDLAESGRPVPLLVPDWAAGAAARLRLVPEVYYALGEEAVLVGSLGLGAKGADRLGKTQVLNELLGTSFLSNSASYITHGTADMDTGRHFKPDRGIAVLDFHGRLGPVAGTAQLAGLGGDAEQREQREREAGISRPPGAAEDHQHTDTAPRSGDAGETADGSLQARERDDHAMATLLPNCSHIVAHVSAKEKNFAGLIRDVDALCALLIDSLGAESRVWEGRPKDQKLDTKSGPNGIAVMGSKWAPSYSQ